jgi:cysteine desulfurase
MEYIYLDYNSTTPVDPQVAETMRQVMVENYANPSSVHSMGNRVRAAIEAAREKIASLLGADPSEIYFTSGGTEADNMALKGAALALQSKGNHLVTSKIEHHAVLESAHYLEKHGFEVAYLGCGLEGIVSADDLKKSLTPKTTVVSVMMANNETGAIQPVKEMAAVSRQAGVLFHTDAVQAIGKLPVRVDDLGVDMLSLSAHKFYGPKGVGALYIRKGVKLTPLLHGGSHERRKRAGTENSAGIIAMAQALEIAESKREAEHARMTELSEYFINQVQARIKEVYLNGDRVRRVPSTVNLSFKGVEGEAIILSLDMKGICVSSGSACTSGSLQASHVLTAMGVDVLLAQGSIRFSMGRYTTRQQLDYTILALPEIIDRLRSMSAAYDRPA